MSLCAGAEEAVRDFLSRFAIDMLNFDDELLQTYQSAATGHRRFYCRLIESWLWLFTRWLSSCLSRATGFTIGSPRTQPLPLI
ncbi:hypothetical protein VTI74DRAFT_7963 [Chaetomium olivicolor]